MLPLILAYSFRRIRWAMAFPALSIPTSALRLSDLPSLFCCPPIFIEIDGLRPFDAFILYTSWYILDQPGYSAP